MGRRLRGGNHRTDPADFAGLGRRGSRQRLSAGISRRSARRRVGDPAGEHDRRHAQQRDGRVRRARQGGDDLSDRHDARHVRGQSRRSAGGGHGRVRRRHARHALPRAGGRGHGHGLRHEQHVQLHGLLRDGGLRLHADRPRPGQRRRFRRNALSGPRRGVLRQRRHRGRGHGEGQPAVPVPSGDRRRRLDLRNALVRALAGIAVGRGLFHAGGHPDERRGRRRALAGLSVQSQRGNHYRAFRHPDQFWVLRGGARQRLRRVPDAAEQRGAVLHHQRRPIHRRESLRHDGGRRHPLRLRAALPDLRLGHRPDARQHDVHDGRGGLGPRLRHDRHGRQRQSDLDFRDEQHDGLRGLRQRSGHRGVRRSDRQPLRRGHQPDGAATGAAGGPDGRRPDRHALLHAGRRGADGGLGPGPVPGGHRQSLSGHGLRHPGFPDDPVEEVRLAVDGPERQRLRRQRRHDRILRGRGQRGLRHGQQRGLPGRPADEPDGLRHQQRGAGGRRRHQRDSRQPAAEADALPLRRGRLQRRHHRLGPDDDRALRHAGAHEPAVGLQRLRPQQRDGQRHQRQLDGRLDDPGPPDRSVHPEADEHDQPARARQ